MYLVFCAFFMFMVCDILGLCCIVNCTVCMFLLWLPYGVINYDNILSRVVPSYYGVLVKLLLLTGVPPRLG